VKRTLSNAYPFGLFLLSSFSRYEKTRLFSVVLKSHLKDKSEIKLTDVYLTLDI